MEYSKEFKQALSEFSAVEKDKLIFRLLKKDKLLSKKLYFELIDLETVDDKRNTMEENIHEKVVLASKYIANQKAHHENKTFQDEYRGFLKKYNVEYDERYVWD